MLKEVGFYKYDNKVKNMREKIGRYNYIKI